MIKTFLLIFATLAILPGCSVYRISDFDSLKEVELSHSEEFVKGNDRGYEDAKTSKHEHLNSLYPLMENYSEYDLGYIDGFHVGCHEINSDNCNKVDELIEQILNDETGKYEIQMERKERIIK